MTKFPDGRIDAVIGINKNISLPELLDDFPPRNQVPLLGHQQDEQLQGLGFDTQWSSLAEQLETPAVEFELLELKNGLRHRKGLEPR